MGCSQEQGQAWAATGNRAIPRGKTPWDGNGAEHGAARTKNAHFQPQNVNSPPWIRAEPLLGLGLVEGKELHSKGQEQILKGGSLPQNTLKTLKSSWLESDWSSQVAAGAGRILPEGRRVGAALGMSGQPSNRCWEENASSAERECSLPASEEELPGLLLLLIHSMLRS